MQKHIAVSPAQSAVNVRSILTPRGLTVWHVESATVPLVSLMGLAGVLETGGGLLLVLGLFTRPIATVLLLEMLYAFATVHLPQGGAPIQNHGELPLLYALIWAFLAGNGAGQLGDHLQRLLVGRN